MREGEVCIINIGPRERRKRMLSGVVLLAVAVVAGALLFASGVGRPWRVLLFLPLVGAATGWFQARDKT